MQSLRSTTQLFDQGLYQHVQLADIAGTAKDIAIRPHNNGFDGIFSHPVPKQPPILNEGHDATSVRTHAGLGNDDPLPAERLPARSRRLRNRGYRRMRRRENRKFRLQEIVETPHLTVGRAS